MTILRPSATASSFAGRMKAMNNDKWEAPGTGHSTRCGGCWGDVKISAKQLLHLLVPQSSILTSYPGTDKYQCLGSCFVAGAQGLETLWFPCGLDRREQQSTGLLHFYFSSPGRLCIRISPDKKETLGHKDLKHYGFPAGLTAGSNSPPDCRISSFQVLVGSASEYHRGKRTY